jgi:transposase
MNPIEMAFAKLKTLLRQAQERTRDGLWQRIGTLLDQFTLVPLHRRIDGLIVTGTEWR